VSVRNEIAEESMAGKGVRGVKRTLDLERHLKCLNTGVGALKGTILQITVFCRKSESVGRSVMSDSLRPHGL